MNTTTDHGLSKNLATRFMRARYPDAVFNAKADSWILPNGAGGFSLAEARAMAQAEIDLFEQGIATRPGWY